MHKQGNRSSEEILDDGRTKYHDINTTDDGRNSVLIAYYASADTTYYCRFSNFQGSKEKYFRVMVHGLGAGIIAAIVIVVAFIIVAIILLIFFIKSSYKQKVPFFFKIISDISNYNLNFLNTESVSRVDQQSFEAVGRQFG